MNNNKCPKCGRKMIWIENYISLDGFWRCKNKKCEIVYQTRLKKILERFNLTYNGCGDLYYKVGDLMIEYMHNVFTLGYDSDNRFYPLSYNHSLDTIESILGDGK